MTTVQFRVLKQWANRTATVQWSTEHCPGWMHSHEMPIRSLKTGEFLGCGTAPVPAVIEATCNELEDKFRGRWNVNHREDRQLAVSLTWEPASA